MNVLYDNSGNPIFATLKNSVVTTKDAPIKITNPDPNLSILPINVGKYKIAPWGDSNDYPQVALAAINRSTVLGAALRFKIRVILSQGVYAYKITGFNQDASPIIEIVNDIETINVLNSKMVRDYLEAAARDLVKFGTAFPLLVPNLDGSKFSSIYCRPAQYCRFEIMNKGLISKVFISGNFPDSKEEDIASYFCLNPENPNETLDLLTLGTKQIKAPIIYPIRDLFAGNSYYGLPEWEPARQSGWLDIAEQIPTFLKAMYNNQINIKFHIKIPYAYWERQFPENIYRDRDQRKLLIEAEMDSIEATLSGSENAHKAIISQFQTNEKNVEEKWEIDPVSQPWSQENLMTSAVANSEILFSLGINPAVFGAGMPGAGPYSSASGGSNIREAFLINVALSWLEQQRILDPLSAFLKFNGVAPEVRLGFQKTILTTLDTGAGTKNVA